MPDSDYDPAEGARERLRREGGRGQKPPASGRRAAEITNAYIDELLQRGASEQDIFDAIGEMHPADDEKIQRRVYDRIQRFEQGGREVANVAGEGTSATLLAALQSHDQEIDEVMANIHEMMASGFMTENDGNEALARLAGRKDMIEQLIADLHRSGA